MGCIAPESDEFVRIIIDIDQLVKEDFKANQTKYEEFKGELKAVVNKYKAKISEGEHIRYKDLYPPKKLAAKAPKKPSKKK